MGNEFFVYCLLLILVVLICIECYLKLRSLIKEKMVSEVRYMENIFYINVVGNFMCIMVDFKFELGYIVGLICI